MKDILVFLCLLVGSSEVVNAAAGDEVVSLFLTTGNKCLGTSGTAMATPSNVTDQAALASSCIILFMVDAMSNGQFVLQKLDDQNMKMRLVNGAAPTFVSDGTETPVQFAFSMSIIAIGTPEGYTNPAVPYKIQTGGSSATAAACLNADAMYLSSACGDVEWIGVRADCQAGGCKDCETNVLRCVNCTLESDILLSDKSACRACSEIVDDCSTCNATGGNVTCAACTNGKELSNQNTCECPEGEEENEGGTDCIQVTTTESSSGNIKEASLILPIVIMSAICLILDL